MADCGDCGYLMLTHVHHGRFVNSVHCMRYVTGDGDNVTRNRAWSVCKGKYKCTIAEYGEIEDDDPILIDNENLKEAKR